MAKIDTEKLEEFVNATKNHQDLLNEYHKVFGDLMNGKNLWVEVQSGGIKDEELLQKFDLGLMDRLENDCVASYVADLKKYDNFKDEYFTDIKRAAGSDDIYLLQILFRVPEHLPLLDQAIDLFLLNYLAAYFKKGSYNKVELPIAKKLFENILDTAAPNLDQYTEVVKDVLTLGKSEEWYEDFYESIRKLISLLPVSGEAFLALKRGLEVTPNKVKQIVQEYIDTVYFEQGLIDNRYNWRT